MQQQQVQPGIWVGNQYMVPAMMQPQGKHTQIQGDGTEWNELDNANVEKYLREQEEQHPAKAQEVTEQPQGWVNEWFPDSE